MRILVGMSGGVDSAYAALKLKNSGHEVEGAVLKMHEYTECDAAERVADEIGIRLHTLDFRECFDSVVVSNFINEYKNARTPNPCVICNSEIKFKKLYEYAIEQGFDAIATGHYANVLRISADGKREINTPKLISEINGKSYDVYRYAISMGTDSHKDQSYMLWRLPQEILSRLIFPLGDDEKISVREGSRSYGISAADRDESQEICFILDGDYAAYIEERTGERSPHGNFVDEEGNVLGEHKGIIRYTLGQRRGLGVSAKSRIFVTEINPEKNTVTLSPNDAYSEALRVRGIVFSGTSPKAGGFSAELYVKLRYAAPRVKAKVAFLDDNTAYVELSTPVRAVTPGQSAVFYDGQGCVLAGGFID